MILVIKSTIPVLLIKWTTITKAIAAKEKKTAFSFNFKDSANMIDTKAIPAELINPYIVADKVLSSLPISLNK